MFVTPLRYCGPKHLNGMICVGHSNIGQIVANISRASYSSDKGKECKEPDQIAGRRVEPWPRVESIPTPWRAQCPQEPPPVNYDPYRIKVPEVVVPPLPPSNAKPMIECARTKGPCSGKMAPPPAPCPPPPPPPPFPWIYVYVVSTFFTIMGMIYKFYLWKEEWDKNSDSKPIWRPRRKIKRPFHEADLPPCVQYLIVGTGAAGWAAYRAIQQHDKTAKVLFVTKEDCIPYMRPPMSKYMWWNPEPPDLKTLSYIKDMTRQSMFYTECRKFMDPVKFYRKKEGPAVALASGWCVVRLDADDHAVYVHTTCGEQPIYYERCLLATGAKAKNLSIFKSAPKAVRDKVQTLRTIRDLEVAYRRVKDSKHVTIIGGGPLGTELAWHLAKMNEVVKRDADSPPIQFVHMYKDRGILSSIVPEYLGVWAAENIKCQNAQLMPNTQVYDVFPTKDGRIELTLSNGSSLVTDYVLVAVGAEPRTELAECSYLEVDPVNGGYKVNTEMEARKHLYVAGDAASVYSQWKDTRLRFEHYDNAEDTGYIAGANMAGHWLPVNEEPHFWLRLGKDLEMEVVGEVGACMPTIGLFKPCDSPEEVAEATAATARSLARDNKQPDTNKQCYEAGEGYEHKYRRGMLFYLRDEIVVGVVFWNMPPIDDRREVATEILRAKRSYKDINLLAELLGFPETQCTYAAPEEEAPVPVCIKDSVRRSF